MAALVSHFQDAMSNRGLWPSQQEQDSSPEWNLFDLREDNGSDLIFFPSVDTLEQSIARDSSLCDRCVPWHSICFCDQEDQPDLFLPVFPHPEQQELSPLRLPITRQRNEVSEAQRQEMESSAEAGIIAAPPTIFPGNPYTDPINSSTVTSAVPEVSGHDMVALGGVQPLSMTPDPLLYSGHAQSSNVRGTVEEQESAANPSPNSVERDVANLLTNGNLHLANGHHMTGNVNSYDDVDGNAAALQQFDASLYSNGPLDDKSVLDTHPQETSAYAKISFPDGDFLVTTHNVMIGRNMEVFKNLKRKKKAERRAREAMDSYRKEPSQPSQHEDGDQQANPPSSNQSLEGRPAPPSNVSERGGVMSYQAFADGHANTQRTSREKRRSHAISKSSSTTSIDPAVIQGSITSDKKTTFGSDGEPVERTYASIPVHTQKPEDITRISKQHLEFRFNFQIAQWEAEVVGNGAMINEKYRDKGEVVALEHNDEIMVSTVHMVFKLPDNLRGSPGISHGTFSRSDDDFSDEDDIAPGTSPVRRLSLAMMAGDSDDDDDIKEAVSQPKSKPKSNRKQEDQKKKKPKKDPAKEASTETAKKAKKPKAGDKPSPAAKAERASTPPRIEPGSILEAIAPDELPQKRKGPGRPPKNGLVSKRDINLVEKRMKELEKRGEVAPSFDVLVNMIRAETKFKEQRQKALQNGEIDPGTSVVPSIEHGGNQSTAKPTVGPKTATAGQTDTTADPARKESSPKPHKKPELSASPIPPRESFTEEQMKKPPGTYVTIINEILSEHPRGEADLPDIYHRIQKKYPHFHYNVNTQGWQSSVRHNLLQHARFIEKGKSGKGKFWAIDESIPLEKEQKKQRKTPPTARPMHMQQPGQYGQAQYGNPYGNGQANGQPSGANQPGSAYYSPYAQPGQNAQYGGPHPSSANAQRPNSGQPAKPKTQWQLMVDEFVKLHHWYRATFQGKSDEEMTRKEAFWTEALGQLSEAFHTGVPSTSPLPTPSDETDARVLNDLKGLFANEKLVEAAKEQQKNMTATVNRAVETGAASPAQASQTNGAVVANQTVAGGPDSAAQMSASGSLGAAQAGSYPNVNDNGVSGGMVVEPANSVPPTASQQPSPGGAGTKRSAEDADDDPAAKRIKGE